MPEELDYGLGLIDSPPPSNAGCLDAYVGAAPIAMPESYIVPAFCHWFDDRFEPIDAMVFTAADGKPFTHNQASIPSCVGHGSGLVKTDHEGTPMSSRDAWNRAKRIDLANGTPLTAYGSSMWSGIEGLDQGIATEATVPSPGVGLTVERYLDLGYVTPAVEAERALHAGARKPYFVSRDLIQETLYKTGHAVSTSLQWYDTDFAITIDMGMPTGKSVGGHCVACIGWICGNLVMVNSWGKLWGWHGMFLVPIKDVLSRFSYAYVHVDAANPLPELLARYDGKNVKLVGTPDCYRCELGVLRKWPDEICFWAHGHTFSVGLFDIPKAEFDLIPKGAPKDMTTAPSATKELVREIRMWCGKL